MDAQRSPQARYSRKHLERGGGGEEKAGAASPSPLEATCPTPSPCSEFCAVQHPAPALKALLGIRCPEALHGILSIM